LLLLLAAGTAEAAAADWQWNLAALAGARELQSDTWRSTNDQYVLGATLDFRRLDWPVSIAFTLADSWQYENCARHDSLFSCGDWYTVGRVRDLTVGARKTWEPGERTNLFLGAGPSLVTAKLRDRRSGGPEGKDTTWGAGLEGGAYWRAGSTFFLGLYVRSVLGANIRFSGERVDADFFEFGVLFGVRIE